jgi:hypothetical protein
MSKRFTMTQVPVITILLLLTGMLVLTSAFQAHAVPITDVNLLPERSDSVLVRWTTAAPVQSQLVLIDEGGRPYRVIASTGSTTHEARVTGLAAGQIVSGSILAIDGQGTISSAPTPQIIGPTVGVGAYDYSMSFYGPRVVYRGSDLFLGYKTALLSGQPQPLTITLAGPGSDTFTPFCQLKDTSITWCGTSPTDSGRVSTTSFTTSATAAFQYTHTGYGMLRVQTKDVPAGTHTVFITTSSGGITRQHSLQYAVLERPPQRSSANAAGTQPIPDRGVWEYALIGGARQFCPAGVPIINDVDHDIFNMDVVQALYNAASYTGNTTIAQCADTLAIAYAQAVLNVQGNIDPSRVHAQGLRTHFTRTGDTRSRTAALLLGNASGYAVTGGCIDGCSMRTTANVLGAYRIAEQLGAPAPLLNRTIEFALGQLEQTMRDDKVGNMEESGRLEDMEDIGMLTHALIDIHNHSKDERIAIELRRMGEWLWQTRSAQRSTYETPTIALSTPTREPMLAVGSAQWGYGDNYLIAGLYAWLYREFGNETYRERADQLFLSAVRNPDPELRAFVSAARFSTDHVRERGVFSVESATWRATSTDAEIILFTNTPTRTTVTYAPTAQSQLTAQVNSSTLQHWHQIVLPALMPGTSYQVQLQSMTASGAQTIRNFTLTTQPSTVPTIAIDAGSATPTTTADGVVWQADTAFTSGGSVVQTTNSIARADSSYQALLRTARQTDTAPLTYTIPTAPGRYAVTIYLAQTTLSGATFDSTVAQRVQEVAINDQTETIDIVATAGGPNTLIERTYVIESNGTIILTLRPRIGDALLQAIKATPLPTKPPEDLDGDGMVTANDVQLLATHIATGAPFNASRDIQKDGTLNLFDVMAVNRRVQ